MPETGAGKTRARWIRTTILRWNKGFWRTQVPRVKHTSMFACGITLPTIGIERVLSKLEEVEAPSRGRPWKAPMGSSCRAEPWVHAMRTELPCRVRRMRRHAVPHIPQCHMKCIVGSSGPSNICPVVKPHEIPPATARATPIWIAPRCAPGAWGAGHPDRHPEPAFSALAGAHPRVAPRLAGHPPQHRHDPSDPP